MTAISRSVVQIAIDNNDTDGSTIVAGDYITGEIKNYSKSGGDKDVESDPHFGGFVDKEKPREQVEVSFEITPSLESPLRWETFAYVVDSGNAGIYTMAGDPALKSVFIQASASEGVQSMGFNNCNVTLLDIDHSADDNRTYNMTLKFSPTDGSGVSNFMAGSVAVTALPDWDALDNN